MFQNSYLRKYSIGTFRYWSIDSNYIQLQIYRIS